MRLIDIDEIFKNGTFVVNGNYMKAFNDLLNKIQSAPTIDPIHAVGGCYCRACSLGRKPHAVDMQDGYVYCQEQSKYMSADDFCSGGEPKEDSRE